MEENTKVIFEMDDGTSFTVELYPEHAPETVENFIELVNDGFYDGLTFHRIIPGFMTQGGDPEGTGMGGSGTNITGEFAQNGITNNLKHERGVTSMARSMMPNSASSQFFICFDDAPHLDGAYAAFGKVIEGMDAVDTDDAFDAIAEGLGLENERIADIFYLGNDDNDICYIMMEN